MKSALQVFSWIAIILGACAVIGAAANTDNAMSALIGGALFLTEGILAIAFIKEAEKRGM